jgi:hypothetical protein
LTFVFRGGLYSHLLQFRYELFDVLSERNVRMPLIDMQLECMKWHPKIARWSEITYRFTSFQTIPCISSELFPCELIEFLSLFTGLLRHEKETPAFQVPSFDLLVVGGHNTL